MSTTCDSDMTTFLDNVFFKIDIDKKKSGLAYIKELSKYSHEEEVLFDKNTKLLIKDITFDENKNIYIVDCKYLDQK